MTDQTARDRELAQLETAVDTYLTRIDKLEWQLHNCQEKNTEHMTTRRETNIAGDPETVRKTVALWSSMWPEDGATLTEATGYWEGLQEPSTLIVADGVSQECWDSLHRLLHKALPAERYVWEAAYDVFAGLRALDEDA